MITTDPGADAPTSSIRSTYLDLTGIQARYRIGKTKAGELVDTPGFPNSVVPGMHRYPVAALDAYDLRYSLHGTVADPANTAPPAPVVVARPPAARPGPKPGAAARKAA